MKKIIFTLACIIGFYGLIAQTVSAPISLSGQTNLIIRNQTFSAASATACIYLNNCSNVKIENCSFIDIPAMVGVQLLNCKNVEIVSCTFRSFRGGVYAQGGSEINVHCNKYETIIGPRPRGQIVQFNGVTGSGNRINYNILEHKIGDGDPEDLINCYASSGTATDPLQVKGNQLRGGGPSTSGGGIMVGDNGGHDILVQDNILVDPGQYGIGVPAGSNITVRSNKIYAKQQSFTNVGLYVGLQGEINAGFACTGNTIRIEGNQVNWTNKNGIKNGFYNCGCCSGIISSGNNFNAPITASILPTTLSLSTTQCSAVATNAPPQLTITAPVSGAAYTAPATITMSATASDVDGTISKVEFYNGAILLFSDATAPYAYSWTNVASGTYTISIKAYDNAGATASKSAGITVNSVVVSSKGINGPSCITAGSTASYTLVPEYTSVSNISYWSNSASTLTTDPSDAKKFTLKVPSSLNGSTVTLYAGVNYTGSPWYKEYTKVVKVGGCAARTATISPQPFQENTQVSVEGEKIKQVQIYDAKGILVQSLECAAIETISLGGQLSPGIYTLVILTEEGSSTTRMIKE